MAHQFANIAAMSTATTGTGTMTLGSAVANCLSFAAAGITNGNTVYYTIRDGTNTEVGIGTYTSSGTTLSRDTVYSSTNSGSKISLSGSATVFVDVAATWFTNLNTDYNLGGRLVNVQIITTTGAFTFTKTSGTNYVIMELVGAGGGGGAVAANPGSGKVSMGGSGSGGAWLRKKLTANFDGGTGSVGAKGAGGASGGANNGNNGGDTSFTVAGGSGTNYVAGGGLLGGVATGVTPPAQTGVSAGGTVSGSGTPDLKANGGASLPGVAFAITFGTTGAGGNSQYGQGATPATFSGLNSSTAGVNGQYYGVGGSGAIAEGTSATQKGGDGADGLAIFWEYT